MPEQTNDIIDELISAILEKKDIAEISQIISGIPDINQPGKYGKTPLLISAEKGHTVVIELLLKHTDIDPNQAGADNGATPLFIAAKEGHEDVVKLLLADSSIKVNQARINDGATPLYIAAQNGHANVVELLLEQTDIDPNLATIDDGITPILTAVFNGHLAVVKLLLDHEKIDINKALPNGTTPLFIAAAKDHLAVVGLLLEHQDIDPNLARTDNGATPLYIAAQNGHTEIANLIKKQIIKQILPKIDLKSVCCISDEVISEDGTTDGERTYSTGRHNLYTERSIREWLRRGRGSASDPITREIFRNEDLIDLTDEIKKKFKAIKIQAIVRGRQGRATARAFNQEGVLAVEVDQPANLLELSARLNSLSDYTLREQDPVSELIFRIEQLETNGLDLGLLNISKIDGKYIYHYDPDNRTAAMLEKELKNLTPEQQEELLGRIIVEEAKLSEPSQISETAIEGQGSFVSRVTAKNKTAVCCNVM